MVSKKATKIASIIPCRVIFADSAGLKLKFNRQITEQELTRIEALFPESEAMQAGLDRYISEWDGKTRLRITSYNVCYTKLLRLVGKPQDEAFYEEYKEIYRKVIGNNELPIVYNVNFGEAITATSKTARLALAGGDRRVGYWAAARHLESVGCDQWDGRGDGFAVQRAFV